MLVLSRHKNQEIVFPHLGITISVIQISSKRVRVGIEAPPDIAVMRGELARRLPVDKSHGNPQSRESQHRSDFLRDRSESSSAEDIQNMGHPSSDTATGPSLSVTDARLQRHLRSAVQILTELADHCDEMMIDTAKPLIDDVLHELAEIDEEAARIHDRDLVTCDAKQSALLVDDNENEAKLLASFLKFRNFDVEIASDGRAALEYLQNNETPDLMLVDMVMPQLDGASTIRMIRRDEKHRNARVFGVSGGCPEDYGLSLQKDGVDGWFQKPVDPEEMVFRLNREASKTEVGYKSHDRKVNQSTQGCVAEGPCNN